MINTIPIQHITTDRLRDLSIENRNCRYLDEQLPNSMFNYYSQKSCLFECKLRESQKRANCTPWNYPYFTNETHRICDDYQAVENHGEKTESQIFLESMKSPEIRGICLRRNCLPDCETVQFKYEDKVRHGL